MDEEQARADALLADLACLAGSVCVACQEPLCGHELTLDIALGFRDAPRCLECLARGLSREATELREELLERVLRRECFRQGWEAASAREGRDPLRPECLWPADVTEYGPPRGSTASAPGEDPPLASRRWDAGDMSCGDLVLALRHELAALAPLEVLELRATDLAAPEDIPAWCRITRNPLVCQRPPLYWIQRKDPR